jgi:hypothetical protein
MGIGENFTDKEFKAMYWESMTIALLSYRE